MSERAVSTTVTWALTLLITTLLISGVLIATGQQISDRTESVTRTEMEVIGQQVVSDLAAADRLARTDPETVVVRTRLPPSVALGGYTVETVARGGDVTVVVSAEDQVVRVPVANHTAVRNASVRGGTLEIALEGGALEVRDA